MGIICGSSCKTTSKNVTLNEYQWRLCVSYQKLNQFTLLFAFPIPHFYDAVQDIKIEEEHFIDVYMDSGYCQVVSEYQARKRLEFFTLYGKRWWKVVPMGALNSAPKFVFMMMKLQMEWETIAKERGFKMLHQNLFLLIMCYCMGAHPSSSQFISEQSWISLNATAIQ